jgi:hypothetical protein
MPRRSVSEVLAKALAFLYGLRVKEAARRLRAHGFTAEERKRGWELFLAVAQGSHTTMPEFPSGDEAEALRELDALENRWFPIARATLHANFPAVEAVLFDKLAQSSGRDVIVSMSLFSERLEMLAGASDAEKQAAALLETRGLTSAVRDRIKALLATIKNLEAAAGETAGDEDAADADLQAGTEALWTWYQQWAEIARVVIPKKSLRIRLGVSEPSSSESDDDTDDPA